MDNIFYYTNSDYRKFYNEYITNKYEFDIKYWYDMNRKQFIDNLHDYDSKVFYSINTTIQLYDNPILGQDRDIYSILSLSKYNIDKYRIKMLLETQNSQNNSIVMEQTKIYKVHLILDDYLNIYIPELNTLIVYNYIKFPLYSLFLLKNSITIKSIYSFNEHNNEDMIFYRLIFSYIDVIYGEHYEAKKSDPLRYKYIHTQIFSDISTFIEYDKYIKIITPMTNLSKYILKCNDICKTSNIIDNTTLEITQLNNKLNEIQMQQYKMLDVKYSDNLTQFIQVKQENKKLLDKYDELINLDFSLKKKINNIKKDTHGHCGSMCILICVSAFVFWFVKN